MWYNNGTKEGEVKTMATLNVNDKRTASKKRIIFADLPIGEVFEDDDNVLCIKIDDGHCLFRADDDQNIWEVAACYDDDVAFPLRATLIIEGRE